VITQVSDADLSHTTKCITRDTETGPLLRPR
jgi:hypothetical protein